MDITKVFDKSDLSTITKLKSAPAKSRTPNWKKRAHELESQAQDSKSSAKSPSPVVTQLDDADISTFATGRPLVDEPDYSICKYCREPTMKSTATQHVKRCLKLKSEKTKERKKAKEEKAAAAAAALNKDTAPNGEANGNAILPDKKGAKKMTKKDSEGKSKKRKADEKLPKEPKAKKKKEKPAKPDPKPKAPVDVEKQCGVQLANGALCARSLTCKSHSMGAKRAVLGRSQPYDILLAAYQKKNQAKQQKAAINAGAPPPDEIEANALPVDSDEETELVMAAVARNIPRPIEMPYFIPVRRKSQYHRMKDLMGSALRPRQQPFGSGIMGSGGFGGTNLTMADGT